MIPFFTNNNNTPESWDPLGKKKNYFDVIIDN